MEAAPGSGEPGVFFRAGNESMSVYHTKLQVGDNVKSYGVIDSLRRERGVTRCMIGGREVVFSRCSVSLVLDESVGFYERIAETSPWW